MLKKEVIMFYRVLRKVGRTAIMIKKILTLKVVFNNVLGTKKYRKVTTIPKNKICVLGISKL